VVIITFGEKLQTLRKQNGLSQEQLSSQLTISRQAISKWELDSSLPDTENIIMLSKLFNVSIDYLLKDEIENTDDGRIKTDNITESSKRFVGGFNNILGILFSSIGLIGVLIIGILSSINPVVISSAVVGEDTSTVSTGLSAFLEYHNIGWLFVLCSIMVLSGIIIILYPFIKMKKTKIVILNRTVF
jgi:transcriptional regulator with XRE-family HTH domain